MMIVTMTNLCLTAEKTDLILDDGDDDDSCNLN